MRQMLPTNVDHADHDDLVAAYRYLATAQDPSEGGRRASLPI